MSESKQEISMTLASNIVADMEICRAALTTLGRMRDGADSRFVLAMASELEIRRVNHLTFNKPVEVPRGTFAEILTQPGKIEFVPDPVEKKLAKDCCPYCLSIELSQGASDITLCLECHATWNRGEGRTKPMTATQVKLREKNVVHHWDNVQAEMSAKGLDRPAMLPRAFHDWMDNKLKKQNDALDDITPIDLDDDGQLS